MAYSSYGRSSYGRPSNGRSFPAPEYGRQPTIEYGNGPMGAPTYPMGGGGQLPHYLDQMGGININALTKNPQGTALIEKLSAPDRPPSKIAFEPLTPQLVDQIRKCMWGFDPKQYDSNCMMDDISVKGEPVKMASSPTEPGRTIFAAKREVTPGTMMMIETPLVECQSSTAAVIESFLSLSDAVISHVSNTKVRTDLVSREDINDIRSGLHTLGPKLRNQDLRQELEQAIVWWFCFLKTYGWTHDDYPDSWCLYRMAHYLPISCVPNCVIRKLSGGVAALVCISPIKKGEAVTVASPEITLYASTPYRRTEALDACATLCACHRCSLNVDAARRVWCPGCRRQIEATARMTPSAPFAISLNGGWNCPSCSKSFGQDVIPVHIETVLEGAFAKIQNAWDEIDEQTWLGHVAYIQTTAGDALSPFHWLSLGVMEQLTHFYLWRGACASDKKESQAATKLGLWYGMQFLTTLRSRIDEDATLLKKSTGGLFVEVSAPLIVDMLVGALDIGELGLFLTLMSSYLPTVLLQYGSDYRPVNELLLPCLNDLFAFVDDSRRLAPKISRVQFSPQVKAHRRAKAEEERRRQPNPQRDIDQEVSRLSRKIEGYPGMYVRWKGTYPWQNTGRTGVALPRIMDRGSEQPMDGAAGGPPAKKQRRFFCGGK